MELFSELENLSDRKAKPFFDTILNTVVHFQYKLVVSATEVDSNSFNPAISEGTINNMILIVEASNSLQEMIVVFTDRDELIVFHDDAKLFAGLGDFLEPIKLPFGLSKGVDTRLIPCNFLKLLELGQICFQELCQMLLERIKVVGEDLLEQVVELALTQRFVFEDLLELVVVVLAEQELVVIEQETAAVYFLVAECAIKCADVGS
jgi:hypothetical protein